MSARFTADAVAALAAAGIEAEVLGPLTLRVSREDVDATVHLGNLWREASDQPTRRVALLERMVGAVVGSLQPRLRDARALVPLVRHVDAAAGALEAMAPGDRPPLMKVGGPLVGLCAFDLRGRLAIASVRDLDMLALRPERAMATAIENLRDRGPARLRPLGGGRWQAEIGGNLDAGLLLLPELWGALQAELGAPPVVCVPDRDHVFAAAIPASLGALRHQASDHPVWSGLLRWASPGWAVVGA